MGAGERGVSEAELREAVEWIVDRSPDWDERNMRAVQRFNLAIAELARLRAIEAAARAAMERRYALDAPGVEDTAAVYDWEEPSMSRLADLLGIGA